MLLSNAETTLLKNGLYVRLVAGTTGVQGDIGYTDTLNNQFNFLVVKRTNNVIEACLNPNCANGVFKNLGTLSGTFTIKTIGKNVDTGQEWKGEFDESRIFKRAITSGEIADLFARTSPGLIGGI